MPDGHTPTILVVDDEPLVRMDLVDMLGTVGYRTLEAGCAAEAIVILESDPDIRVVFTDIQMPGSMDGLALAHYVRERWPPTIIVICSGNRTLTSSDMPSNVNFIAKPFETCELSQILDVVKMSLSAL